MLRVRETKYTIIKTITQTCGGGLQPLVTVQCLCLEIPNKGWVDFEYLTMYYQNKLAKLYCIEI